MKKEEGIGIRIIRLIVIAVLVVMLIGLFIVHRQQSAVRREALQKRSEELGEEEKTRMLLEQDRSSLYHTMIGEMKIRDLVLWGDGSVEGSDGGSFSETLTGVLYSRMADTVTSLFPNALEYEEEAILEENAETDSTAESADSGEQAKEVEGPRFSYEVHDMGIVNEGMREIFARAGVGSVKTKAWTRIPESREPAEVELVDDEWRTLYFAAQTPPRFGSVEIADIKGGLSGNGAYDDLHPRFEFTRSEEGEARTVQSGTPVYFESMSRYRDCVPVLFFDGETVSDAEEFVENVHALVADEPADDAAQEGASGDGTAEEAAEMETAKAAETETAEAAGTGVTADMEYAAETEPGSENTEKLPYVVICTTQEGSQLDEILKENFGERYIRNDNVPEDMTQDDYDALAANVMECLDAQGYFRAVVQAQRNAENALQELH